MAKNVANACCTLPLVLLLTAGLPLTGCSYHYLQPVSPQQFPPALYHEIAVMNDGYVLPLRKWGPESAPRAIVVALHGFNDYSRAFATLGEFLADAGIMTLAYDQRGFGQTTYRGRWPGVDRLVEDLSTVTSLLRQAHGTTPCYVMGESMGGALALSAAGNERLAGIAGLILSAPAVWGRQTMSPLMRATLWVSANTLPWFEVTGRGLKIMASDNREMLLALGRDPLIIKSTRLDAINGLTDLMDAGLDAVPKVRLPTLLLYGDKDQVVPKVPICALIKQSQKEHLQVITYGAGYHMLTRDLQRQHVLQDILDWLNQGAAGLSAQAAPMGRPAWCPD